MNRKRGTIRAICAGVIVGCSLWCSAGAQAQFGMDPMQTNAPVSPMGHTVIPGGRPADPLESMMAARTRLERNIDRQKHLVIDTQRLLALANELNTEIASSGTETMTPAMLHKMDEIEKLARSVKDKMRD
jgi:hypothetical protein